MIIKLAVRNKLWRSLILVIFTLVLSLAIHLHFPLQVRSQSALDLVQESKEYYELGQFSAAESLLKQALETYKTDDNKIQQARTLSLLSLIYEKLGKDELAKKSLNVGLNLLKQEPRTNSSDRVQGQILNRLGRWQLAKGMVEASFETFKQAEIFYAQAQDLSGKAISQINQAQALQLLGFSNRSTKMLERLSEQIAKQSSPELQLSLLSSLGISYYQQGNFNRAEEILEESLTLARSLERDSKISKILLTLGNLKLTQAKFRENSNNQELLVNLQDLALEYYQEAEEIAIFPLAKVQAQLNQFKLLVETDHFIEAEKLILPIFQNTENLTLSRGSIYALINFADSLQQLPTENRSKLEIQPLLTEAIADARKLADKRAESLALGAIGHFYEINSETELAQKYTKLAIARTQNLDAVDLKFNWQWQLGRLLVKQNKFQQAITAYAKSVENLDSLRFDIAASPPELRFSFRDNIEPVYREYISLLLRSPEPSQANLQKSIEVAEKLKVAELDNLFRNACVQAKSQDISQLDPNTAVIYPLVLETRLELILKLPNQDRLYYYSQEDIAKSEIDGAVAQLQKSLAKRSTSPRELKQQEAQFYDWLIKPFTQELETTSTREASQIKNLVFVLDGTLRNLPMSALYDGQNYLISRYGVAISPGIKLVTPQRLARDKLKVLLAGTVNGPSFESRKLPPLNNVATEIAGIAQTVNRTKVLEEQDFLQTKLQNQINNSSFNIVHIATHGQFSSNPQDTYILDWEKTIGLADLERLLTTDDFTKAKVIDLLVLSACETAISDRQGALGLAGVAVQSGASSTLASLWQVNDASTAEFMIEFYRQLTNSQLSKAEALRNTQLNFLAKSNLESDYNRPYHWAAFILVGDWR